jgi:hypothetical protein
MDDVMLCQKRLQEGCRMGRRIVVMKLICSLGRCECDAVTQGTSYSGGGGVEIWLINFLT